MNTPSESVFEAAELLEAILIYAGAHTVLISATRVCLRWNSLINASLPLQRALYFHPIDNTNHITEEGESICHKVQNPFLKDIFPAWFREPIDLTFDAYRSGGGHRRYRSNYLARRIIVETCDKFGVTDLYKQSLASDDNPYLRSSASWRRMLTSQPPCQTVVALSGTIAGDWNLPYVAHQQDGLRMGDLYSITLRQFVHDLTGFKVIWAHNGAFGFSQLVNHLTEATRGWMTSKLEMRASLICSCKPDLVIQLLRTHALASDLLDSKQFRTFCRGCGSGELLADHEDGESSVISSGNLRFKPIELDSKRIDELA
ncbi:hypothetical protein QQS21_004800 [Conoideocrella luteorostrata]|uniref:F-box domain-containing protein n=1 Tax=Conoideocrella luteorostrata TaxID=1105319 RepID=A0AAJ0FV45_9HYPO|nr:hypothetical protein QQS21_004800 [Conoideocrella luteorostrata]